MKNLIALIVLSSFTLISFAQTYYVSPTGNNSNSGTSTSQSFATIQKGLDMAINAGSVLNIMQGTYYEHVVLPNNFATPTNPIIIQNYLNDTVIIDGNGTASTFGSSLFLIQDKSNVVIEGIKFQNAFNSYVGGLLIRGHCENIKVKNCEFENISFSNNFNDTVINGNSSASPLLVYGDSLATTKNIEIDNVRIKHCNTGWSEALTFNGNVDGFSIHDSKVSDIRNIGIDIAGHWGVCSDSLLDQARNGRVSRCVVNNCKNPNPLKPASGIYIDGGRNIVIENDTVFDCQNGITVGCENKNKTANKDTVRNNVVFKNIRAGIEVGGWNYPPMPLTVASGIVTNCFISGNTTVKNNLDSSLWAGEFRITYNENLIVENNLVYGESNHHVLLDYRPNNGINNILNYNIYYTPSSNVLFSYGTNGYGSFIAYKNATGQDSNSLYLDPKLIDTATNFRLQANSPAINAGNPLYSSTSLEYDIDGQNRVIGAIDCGADETNYPNSVVNFNDEQLVVYPNPFNNMIYFTQPIEANSIVLIKDITGNTIYSIQVDKTTQYLDLSVLSSGVFIFHLIKDNYEIATQKIIKY